MVHRVEPPIDPFGLAVRFGPAVDAIELPVDRLELAVDLTFESIEPIAEIDHALPGRREIAPDVRHHLTTFVHLPLEPSNSLFPQNHARLHTLPSSASRSNGFSADRQS
jgi:hypothetical protein